MEQSRPFKLLTEEEYVQVYNTFKTNSRQDNIVRDEITKSMLSRYGGSSIDVLSIGAGKGWLEDYLIRHSGLEIKSIVAIEPNINHVEKLMEKSANWTNTIINIDSSYFDADFAIEKKFDVVLMIHSIYYLKNQIDSIMKAKSLLKPRGNLLMVVQGEKGGFELASLLHDQATIVPSTYNYHPISAECVVDSFKNMGAGCQIREIIDAHDVTDFIQRKGTPTCNDTISFFLHSKYEELEQKLQDDVYAMVKKNAIVTEDNRYFMSHSNNFIIVEND